MAKKIWDNKIDRQTDWGGDESTNNLAVSGARVQEFIKEEFGSKAGLFYYDTINNRYLVFANADTRDEYLEDNTKVELIIGTFDAPFNYSAEINLETPSYNAILTGTKNNYIDFTFDVVNKQGQSVGEDVLCTYTFTRGATKQTKFIKYKYGERVHFNVDEFLGDGTNHINISIVGANTLAGTSVNITYLIVALQLENRYNVATPNIKESGKINSLAIPYQLIGNGTKVLEWYLNGEQLPFNKTDDEVVETTTTRTKFIDIDALPQGKHNLQFRAYVVINSEKFYTNTMYTDFIVSEGKNSSPIIAIKSIVPNSIGILDIEQPLVLYGATQYIPYTLTFGVYRTTTGQNTQVAVKVGTNEPEILLAVNGNEIIYTTTPITSGDLPLVITAENTTYETTLEVDKTITTLEEINYDLELSLSALGKTNNSTQKNVWEYGKYKTQFNGFRWNSTSGWNDNSLVFRDRDSIEINIQALTQTAVNTGKTLEFEFSTTNVIKEDATVCNLMIDDYGLLITASSATLTSVSGKEVTTKFKSGENIRVSFVINPTTGVVNRGLAFIYVNGICTGAVNYTGTDRFLTKDTLVIGGDSNVGIILKSLRFYNTALNHDQILNNYMLYRDTVTELLSLYDRNNIFDDSGTNFSVDLLSRQAPVLIVTGDIPVLENTSDKNETIYVDLEYINNQDPTKSFTSKGTRMRPQGTSSMGYPKKNFRIYTKYGEMFDYQGNKLDKGLYSFKEKAQPVNVWCFKADYAESSGTHNTGIARLWNDAMYNTQIDGQPLLRTEAQKTAVANGYPYDVRTTVDGFPFHIFYKLTPDSDLIYIGKYNFNNDKSTESVFGFVDIPGFNNERVQCLEVLNNGNPHALFQTAEGLDEQWEEAYEFRYPEDRTDISDLKDLTQWLVSTRYSDDVKYGNSLRIQAELFPEQNGVYPDNKENRKLKFNMEKWDYLDVHKVAAYYIYAMRFGAVDQLVKNAMFTTEGTQGKGTHAKWFFINYDNDTINGLRNDGPLIYDYTITRQTLDTSFSAKVYAYAGHESTLWNNLEDNKEFMDIVSKVDNAMYLGGLSFRNVSKMFNIDQASKWCERVYNQDAQYKYIGPYTNGGINNLYMLQGSRTSHRQWWLSNRFALLDSVYVSGGYKANSIEFKAANAPTGLPYTITAGKSFNYGYGLNNVPVETNISLGVNQSHTFNTKQVINVGDPVRVYSAPTLKGLDISGFIEYMSTINVERVNNEETGTYFEDLILGVDVSKSSKRNTSMSAISGLEKATKLANLDISGFKAITALDLGSQKYLKTFKAIESGLTSVVIPEGAPVTLLELPETLQSLVIKDLFSLELNGLNLVSWANIHTLHIENCPKVTTNSISLIQKWMKDKVTENKLSTLYMDNIQGNTDINTLLEIGKLKIDGGSLVLKGSVRVEEELTQQNIEDLVAIYGKDCFDPKNDFYILAPPALFLIGPSLVLEYSEIQYAATAVGYGEGNYRFTKISGIGTITEDGLFKLGVVDSTSTTKIKIFFTEHTTGTLIAKEFDIKVEGRVYPSNGSINGPSRVEQELTTYTLDIIPSKGITGDYSVTWDITGQAAKDNYISIVSSDKQKCIIRKNKDSLEGVVNGTIVASIKGKTTVIVRQPIAVIKEGVLLTKTTHGTILSILYSKGVISNSDSLLKTEAESIKTLPRGLFASKTLEDFEEFQYFTGLVELPQECFNGTRVKLTLPNTLTVLKESCLNSNGLVITNLAEILNTIQIGEKNCLTNLSASNVGKLTVDFNKIKSFYEESYPYTLCSIKDLSIFEKIRINTAHFNNVTIVIQISGLVNLTSLEFYNDDPTKDNYLIELRALYNLPNLQILEFNNRVESIQDQCFYSQTIGSVTDIYIDSHLNYIHKNCISSAFQGKINFVNRDPGRLSVTDGVMYLKSSDPEEAGWHNCLGYIKYAFKGHKLILPPKTLNINIDAFAKLEELEEIVFNDDLRAILSRAFSGTNLKGTVTLPNSLVRMYRDAFEECDGIEELNLANTFLVTRTTTGGLVRVGKSLKKIILGEKFNVNRANAANPLVENMSNLTEVVVHPENKEFKVSANKQYIERTLFTTSGDIEAIICVFIFPNQEHIKLESELTRIYATSVNTGLPVPISLMGIEKLEVSSQLEPHVDFTDFVDVSTLILNNNSNSFNNMSFWNNTNNRGIGSNNKGKGINKVYSPSSINTNEPIFVDYLLNPDKCDFTSIKI